MITAAWLGAAARTVPDGVPIDLGRDDASALARKELADPIYQQAQPSLLERGLRWVLERMSEVLDAAALHSPGGWLGLLGLVLLAVLVVAAVRWRLGPVASRRHRGAALFGGTDVTADDHRREADRFAEAQQWDDAVRERLRAVVRSLEERGVLDPRPGRTAHEAAAEGGRVLPDADAALRRAARTFDDVWFGGRTADAAAYRTVVAADEAVGAARPARPATAGAS